MNIVDVLDTPTAIVGAVGAGKTFTAKGAVEELLELRRRVIIIDPTGAWWGLRSGRDGKSAGGFPVTIFGGDHADVEITQGAGAAIAEALATREVQAIIDVSDMTGGEMVQFLTAFLETLYAKNKAALHLVVDEADAICPQNPMPDMRRLSGVFDKIVRRGRIKGFRPLMITQRPAVLHKNVLSQIGTLIAMKLTSPQDRKAIEAWVQGSADVDQAKDVLTSLSKLQRGEGWVWSPAAGVLERRTFPAIRTFDSSRSPAIGETLVEPALSEVDVAALRQAMFISPPSNEVAKINTPSAAALKEAEERGYQRGLVEGEKRGKAAGVALGLARASLALSKLHIPDIVAEDAALGVRPEPKLTAVTIVGKLPQVQPVPSAPVKLGAERKLLAALAAFYPGGYTEAQWATVVGLKRTGGTWGTYKSRLRAAGLIVERGDLWFATETGVASMGPVPAMPAPGHELVDFWCSRIGAEKRILLVLSHAYPTMLSRATVAEAVGLATSGGTWGTYLSRLRSNGLIHEDGDMLQAHPNLMETSR